MDATTDSPQDKSRPGASPDPSPTGDGSSPRGGAGFFSRNGKKLLWLVVAWALLTGILVWLSAGPQNEPFVYQVF